MWLSLLSSIKFQCFSSLCSDHYHLAGVEVVSGEVFRYIISGLYPVTLFLLLCSGEHIVQGQGDGSGAPV